jgi:D-3-phosphoglycerate dehydrogenase / 2-oxoglutarate reductase
MYRIKMLNRIAEIGLAEMKDGPFEFVENGSDFEGVLVRSGDMHSLSMPSSLLAVARAGAGVNNIPIDAMTAKGVVVFNTPGANANGVKELAIAALLLSCRRVAEGAAWSQTVKSGLPELVEKEKNRFAGPEIQGKRLAVMGLGAVGSMVANAAIALGMEVTGYDPEISVEAAWRLSSQVKRARTLEGLVADADFLSIHVPLLDSTKKIVNDKFLSTCKRGIRIINLSRGGLVDNESVLRAIAAGSVEAYVTDFPEDSLLGKEKVLLIPHLGASTPEAEDNCAVMACRQVAAFLERGSIVNSVNFPACEIDSPTCDGVRLTIMNRNVPAMLGKITSVFAEKKINICEMINKNRGDVAYNIIDIDSDIGDADIAKISSIEGIIRVRKIKVS